MKVVGFDIKPYGENSLPTCKICGALNCDGRCQDAPNNTTPVNQFDHHGHARFKYEYTHPITTTKQPAYAGSKNFKIPKSVSGYSDHTITVHYPDSKDSYEYYTGDRRLTFRLIGFANNMGSLKKEVERLNLSYTVYNQDGIVKRVTR